MAVQAAREAARASSPDLTEHRLTEVEKDMSVVQSAVTELRMGQDRVVRAVEGLTTKVDEWELANSASEVTKVQEEQRTKRFTALVGGLMSAITLAGTIVTNIVMRPAPEMRPAPPMSQTDREFSECNKKPSIAERAACGNEITLRKLSPEPH